LNLTSTINGLNNGLTISCEPLAADGTVSYRFQQTVLVQSVFGSSGLSLSGCTFGGCVRQGVIDSQSGSSGSNGGGGSSQLDGRVGGSNVGQALVTSLKARVNMGVPRETDASHRVCSPSRRLP